MSDVLSQEELDALFAAMGRRSPSTAPAPVVASPGEGQPALAAGRLTAHVPLEALAELGRARLSLQDIAAWRPGVQVLLDRPLATRLNLTVGGQVVARGQAVAVDEHYGVTIELGPRA